MKKFLRFGIFVAAVFVAMPGWSATTKSASKQSAIQQGTKVRAKTAAAGVYSDEC